MRIPATNLDGHALGEVDLARSDGGRAMVNDEVVLAMRPIGSRVALIVNSHQYCVSIADYWHIMGAANSSTAGSETDYHEETTARKTTMRTCGAACSFLRQR